MKNKNLILAIALGVGVYLLTRRRSQAPTQPVSFPAAPPRSNAQAWASWASSMISLFGQSAALFQPGGPFYRMRPEEVNDAIAPYVNPYNDPTGSAGQYV